MSTATIDAAGGWSVQLLPFAAEVSVNLLTLTLALTPTLNLTLTPTLALILTRRASSY